MLIARKAFISFNGFVVYLAAGQDFDAAWRQFCAVNPKMVYEPQDVSCAGYCRATYDHAECFAWVKASPCVQSTDWAPSELAAHEIVHILSHLCRWLGDVHIWQADEPLAYTSAALTRAFSNLIWHAEGGLTAMQVKAELTAIDFDLISSPEHNYNHSHHLSQGDTL